MPQATFTIVDAQGVLTKAKVVELSEREFVFADGKGQILGPAAFEVAEVFRRFRPMLDTKFNIEWSGKLFERCRFTNATAGRDFAFTYDSLAPVV